MTNCIIWRPLRNSTVIRIFEKENVFTGTKSRSFFQIHCGTAVFRFCHSKHHSFQLFTYASVGVYCNESFCIYIFLLNLILLSGKVSHHQNRKTVSKYNNFFSPRAQLPKTKSFESGISKTDATYTFEISAKRVLTAVFEQV